MGKYLLDTNIFIAAYKSYYAFDIAPSFWLALEKALLEEHAVLLNVVQDEILAGDDELKAWFKGNITVEPIDIKDADTILNYSKVLQHVQNCGYYKESALQNWANQKIADPWLIAAAMSKGYTIVTNEVSTGQLSANRQSKNAKIPDVAVQFGVSCINTFDFMRAMGMKL